MPPIERALTEEQIEQRLTTLAHDPARRQAVGAASRAWIQKWHGWERCAGDYQAMYREVMERRGAARTDGGAFISQGAAAGA
jgi:glycosyltransferase involved in cell wall biosynthesis